MRLRYTTPALADLASILDYLAAHPPEAAGHVQTRIKTIISLPLRYPHIGRLTNDPSIHRLTITPYPYAITPYPYLVFYEATDTEIVIHAVRHSTQDPANTPGNS